MRGESHYIRIVQKGKVKGPHSEAKVQVDHSADYQSDCDNDYTPLHLVTFHKVLIFKSHLNQCLITLVEQHKDN